MNWEFRVFSHKSASSTDSGFHLEIHETYYDSDGKIEMISVEGIRPFGEGLEDLRADLEHMMRALTKPILVYSEYGTFDPTSPDFTDQDFPAA